MNIIQKINNGNNLETKRVLRMGMRNYVDVGMWRAPKRVYVCRQIEVRCCPARPPVSWRSDDDHRVWTCRR
jgi:hypothetical protein